MKRFAFPSLRRSSHMAAAFGVAVFCVFVFLFFIDPALAQTALEQVGDASKLPQTDLITIIARLIRAFLGILGIILVILIIYAGFLYMTSGGEAAKTDKAKKLIKQAVIGFVIIMSSFAIVTFVINAILKSTQGSQITAKAPIQKYAEPLASALGAGIIESHYPPRKALDIPRNTKIFITFKEPIDPTTVIQGFKKELPDKSDNQSVMLNTDNIWIFEPDAGLDPSKKPKKMLQANQVKVSTLKGNDPKKEYTLFVFDPVDLLGNPIDDTNYSVALQLGIKNTDGQNAFKASECNTGGCYSWTFEVSTEVDLTPPKVTKVEPPKKEPNETVPKNTTVEIYFNEPMDPVSSTGSYIEGKAPLFSNISILDEAQKNEQGTFEISNGYKTVGFTSTKPCGKDPCGDVIYCLTGEKKLTVTAKAATLDNANPPQAKLIGISYNGLTDAAGNSLDGSGDGIACGTADDNVACANNAQNDDYQWAFNTTNNIDTTVPQLLTLTPGVKAQEIDQNAPLQVTFNIPLKSSTVNSTNASVWPDKLYRDKNQKVVPMWFGANMGATSSSIEITHQPFVSNAQGGWDYYPVLTHGIKGNNQICMYPARIDPLTVDPSLKDKTCKPNADSSKPYCCDGEPSSSTCTTVKEPGTLPGNE